jgi:hypothetical protein
VRERRADAAGGSRQSQAQARESIAVVADGSVVDDEVHFATPFDVVSCTMASQALSRARRETSASASCGNRKSLTTIRTDRRRNGNGPLSKADWSMLHVSNRSMCSGTGSGSGGAPGNVITRESAIVEAHAHANNADSSLNVRCFASVTAIERLTSMARSMRGATSSRYNRTVSSSERA